MSAAWWADPYTFRPATQYGLWYVYQNYCLWSQRVISAQCPLSYDPGTMSPWGAPAALRPGIGASGSVAQFYYSLLNQGRYPARVVVNWEDCNLKGCDSWSESAGPGTGAYIQQWGSSGGSTTLLNTEGVLLAYRPLLLDQSTLAYRQHGFAEPLHCGRVEYGGLTWPAMLYHFDYGVKGGRLVTTPYNVTVTEITTREWYGYSHETGTWSVPVVTYTSPYGSWGNRSDIPNPIVIWY